MRARLSLSVALLAALLAQASFAVAAVGPGPRLAFVESSAAAPMTRLATVAADGSGRVVLPLDGVLPTPFEGPAWTPDGSTLVFSGYALDPNGELRGRGPRLYAVGAEGGTPRALPGTVGGSRPVLSPDGRTVAFKRARLDYRFDPRNPGAFGYHSRATAWIVSLDGGRPRRLTPWLSGLVMIPASFSPDGSTLLLERDREPGWAPEVVARPLGGGPLRLVSRRAEAPAYSPDGASIALIDYRDGLTVGRHGRREAVGELYVLRADGAGARRLTRTPAAQESQPSWSPSGARIAFLRTPGPGGLGFGSRLMQANADGSCARRVTGATARSAPALYGPAWQPGADRAATLLAC